MIEIRPFHVSETASARRLLHDAVRIGAAELYSQEERRAWSASPTPEPEWRDRVADHITLMAYEVLPELDVLAGFGTIRRDGYIDFLFVAPDKRRTGLAGQIYDGLLAALPDPKPETLTVRASLYARPFFERGGWQVTGDASEERNGQTLQTFHMARPYSRDA